MPKIHYPSLGLNHPVQLHSGAGRLKMLKDLSTLSQKSATVQSHFCATVSLICDSITYLRQRGQAFRAESSSSVTFGSGAIENARLELSAPNCRGWKMRDQGVMERQSTLL